jgi:hypothetical protein
MLSVLFRVSSMGPTLRARNGGGDLFYTDGDIVVGVLTREAVARLQYPTVLASPKAMELKNMAWRKGMGVLRATGWLRD